MTLHTAKGLEFPFVFMVGLETGLFPHINSMEGGEEDLEEERRLCYVGITRTQERLFLTYASSRRLWGQQASNLPSRFLTEMPQEVMEFKNRLLEEKADDFFESAEDEIEIDYDS